MPHIYSIYYTRKCHNNSVKIINKKFDSPSFGRLFIMTFKKKSSFNSCRISFPDSTHTFKMHNSGVSSLESLLIVSFDGLARLLPWASSHDGIFARCSANRCSQHSIYFGFGFFVYFFLRFHQLNLCSVYVSLCYSWCFCSRQKNV